MAVYARSGIDRDRCFDTPQPAGFVLSSSLVLSLARNSDNSLPL